MLVGRSRETEARRCVCTIRSTKCSTIEVLVVMLGQTRATGQLSNQLQRGSGARAAPAPRSQRD